MNIQQLQDKAVGLASDSDLVGPIGSIAIDAIKVGTNLARQEGYDKIGSSVMGNAYAAQALSSASAALGLAIGGAMVPVIGWFVSMVSIIASTPAAKSADQDPNALSGYCGSLAPKPRPTGPNKLMMPADLFFVPANDTERMPSVFACAAYSIYETTLHDGRAYVNSKTRELVRALRQAIMASWKVKYGSDGGVALWPVYCDVLSAIETDDRRQSGEDVRVKLFRAAGAYTQGYQDSSFDWYRESFRTYPHLYALCVHATNPIKTTRELVESLGWLAMGSVLCRTASIDPLYAIDELVFQWRLDTDPYYQEGRVAQLRNTVMQALGQPPKLGFSAAQKKKLKRQIAATSKR